MPTPAWFMRFGDGRWVTETSAMGMLFDEKPDPPSVA